MPEPPGTLVYCAPRPDATSTPRRRDGGSQSWNLGTCCGSRSTSARRAIPCPSSTSACRARSADSLLAEVRFADSRVLRELGRRALSDDAPLLEDVGARGDRERLDDVLLHEEHRHTVGVDRGDHLEELIDDLRAPAERGLV